MSSPRSWSPVEHYSSTFLLLAELTNKASYKILCKTYRSCRIQFAIAVQTHIRLTRTLPLHPSASSPQRLMTTPVPQFTSTRPSHFLSRPHRCRLTVQLPYRAPRHSHAPSIVATGPARFALQEQQSCFADAFPSCLPACPVSHPGAGPTSGRDQRRVWRILLRSTTVS